MVAHAGHVGPARSQPCRTPRPKVPLGHVCEPTVPADFHFRRPDFTVPWAAACRCLIEPVGHEQSGLVVEVAASHRGRDRSMTCCNVGRLSGWTRVRIPGQTSPRRYPKVDYHSKCDRPASEATRVSSVDQSPRGSCRSNSGVGASARSASSCAASGVASRLDRWQYWRSLVNRSMRVWRW